MQEHILSIVAALPDHLGDGADATTIKGGIIAGLSLVLAAVLPGVIGKKNHEPRAVRNLRAAEKDLRNELAADRDEWKTTAEKAQAAVEARDAEINRLRLLCMSAHPPINPFLNLEGQA